VSVERQDEQRRPPRPIRRAQVREGTRGDWACTIWLPSEAEAIAIAELVSRHLRETGRAP
jgi:hypothetical protein